MTEILLIATILLLLVVIALLIVLLRQRSVSDLSSLRHRFDSLEKSHDRIERSLRNDIAKNREEEASNARQAREEISNTLIGLPAVFVQNFTVACCPQWSKETRA